ncbi:unnamed protein product [Amoebophrya sp. A120]|nr:unnamed protein product [Amoebophrya sp. A120]|eukprot:GSA120T00024455001.1
MISGPEQEPPVARGAPPAAPPSDVYRELIDWSTTTPSTVENEAPAQEPHTTRKQGAGAASTLQRGGLQLLQKQQNLFDIVRAAEDAGATRAADRFVINLGAGVMEEDDRSDWDVDPAHTMVEFAGAGGVLFEGDPDRVSVLRDQIFKSRTFVSSEATGGTKEATTSSSSGTTDVLVHQQAGPARDAKTAKTSSSSQERKLLHLVTDYVSPETVDSFLNEHPLFRRTALRTTTAATTQKNHDAFSVNIKGTTPAQLHSAAPITLLKIDLDNRDCEYLSKILHKLHTEMRTRTLLIAMEIIAYFLPPDIGFGSWLPTVYTDVGSQYSSLLKNMIRGCSLGEILRIATPYGYVLFRLHADDHFPNAYLIHSSFAHLLQHEHRLRVERLYGAAVFDVREAESDYTGAPHQSPNLQQLQMDGKYLFEWWREKGFVPKQLFHENTLQGTFYSLWAMHRDRDHPADSADLTVLQRYLQAHFDLVWLSSGGGAGDGTAAGDATSTTSETSTGVDVGDGTVSASITCDGSRAATSAIAEKSTHVVRAATRAGALFFDKSYQVLQPVPPEEKRQEGEDAGMLSANAAGEDLTGTTADVEERGAAMLRKNATSVSRGALVHGEKGSSLRVADSSTNYALPPRETKRLCRSAGPLPEGAGGSRSAEDKEPDYLLSLSTAAASSISEMVPASRTGSFFRLTLVPGIVWPMTATEYNAALARGETSSLFRTSAGPSTSAAQGYAVDNKNSEVRGRGTANYGEESSGRHRSINTAKNRRTLLASFGTHAPFAQEAHLAVRRALVEEQVFVEGRDEEQFWGGFYQCRHAPEVCRCVNPNPRFCGNELDDLGALFVEVDESVNDPHYGGNHGLSQLDVVETHVSRIIENWWEDEVMSRARDTSMIKDANSTSTTFIELLVVTSCSTPFFLCALLQQELNKVWNKYLLQHFQQQTAVKNKQSQQHGTSGGRTNTVLLIQSNWFGISPNFLAPNDVYPGAASESATIIPEREATVSPCFVEGRCTKAVFLNSATDASAAAGESAAWRRFWSLGRTLVHSGAAGTAIVSTSNLILSRILQETEQLKDAATSSPALVPVLQPLMLHLDDTRFAEMEEDEGGNSIKNAASASTSTSPSRSSIAVRNAEGDLLFRPAEEALRGQETSEQSSAPARPDGEIISSQERLRLPPGENAPGEPGDRDEASSKMNSTPESSTTSGPRDRVTVLTRDANGEQYAVSIAADIPNNLKKSSASADLEDVGIWARGNNALRLGLQIVLLLRSTPSCGKQAHLVTGKGMSFAEIKRRFTAIVYVPHEFETYAFHELYSLSLAMFVPSRRYLADLVFNDDGNLGSTGSAGALDFSTRVKKLQWLQTSSMYDAEKSPGIIVFRTILELCKLVSDRQLLTEKRAVMRNANAEKRAATMQTWRGLLRQQYSNRYRELHGAPAEAE